MIASIVCGLIIGLDVNEILSNNTLVGYEWLNAIPALPAVCSGFIVWYLFVIFGNLIGDYSDILCERILKIDMDDDESSPTWKWVILFYVPILLMIVATYLLSIGLARIVN